jgi:ketosteroid isomerase-like protein
MTDLRAAREAWEAFVTAGDPEALARVMPRWDPDVEYVEDPRWPGAGTVRGVDAVAERFAEYQDIIGHDVELILEGVRETPAGLVSLVRVRGTSASDVPFDHLWAYRFRMHEGKVVWFRAYFDPAEALAEADD